MATVLALFGRKPAGTDGQQDNLALINATSDQDRAGFEYVNEMRSLDDAVAFLNTDAASVTEDLAEPIAAGLRLGAVYRTVMVHFDPVADQPAWSVPVGDDEIIRPADFVEVWVGRGASRYRRHQSQLVHDGRLYLRHMTQTQIAKLFDYSPAHLRLCGRIFDNRPIAAEAVDWYRANAAVLRTKPRKAEGLDYVWDCIRMFNTYTKVEKTAGKTYEDAMNAAEGLLATRVRPPPPLTTDQGVQRLTTFAIHAIAAMHQQLRQYPTERNTFSLFVSRWQNVKEFLDWSAAAYHPIEQTVWEETQKLPPDRPFSELPISANAPNLYARPAAATMVVQTNVIGTDTTGGGGTDTGGGGIGGGSSTPPPTPPSPAAGGGTDAGGGGTDTNVGESSTTPPPPPPSSAAGGAAAFSSPFITIIAGSTTGGSTGETPTVSGSQGTSLGGSASFSEQPQTPQTPTPEPPTPTPPATPRPRTRRRG